MSQKSELSISLYEVLCYLRNFFPGDRWRFVNEPVKSGGITLPDLNSGDYYLIEGSKRNDGVHVYGENDLIGDTLTGYITECRIPAALVEIHKEINDWQNKNAEAVTSPFQSESFGGYSYTKKSGNAATGSTDSWQSAFAIRLKIWRKI